MKTVVFSSIKGGTGKSSNAIMLSNYLAQAGKRILCIDMDIQNSMTFYYAEDPDVVEDYSIAEALHRGDLEGNIIQTIHGKIHLVPSSLKLVNLRTISVMTLKRLLKQVEQDYDFCIIDTAPTWDNITLNALFAADQILTPVYLTQWDWKGAVFFRDQIVLDLSEEHLDKWSLLVNAWKDPKTDNPDNFTNAVQSLFSDHFQNISEVKIPSMSLVKKYIDTGEGISSAKDKVRLHSAVKELSNFVTEERLHVEAF